MYGIDCSGFQLVREDKCFNCCTNIRSNWSFKRHPHANLWKENNVVKNLIKMVESDYRRMRYFGKLNILTD